MTLALAIPGWGFAQLSPGDLARPHAQLEGLKNCTKCHETGEQITGKNCLSCHTLLRERIDAGKGLHARPDHKDCVRCHSDHHGREFEIVFWKEGQDNFDHGKTGYTLEGGHLGLECNKCHQPANIRQPDRLLKADKNLSRTFLGLTQDCLSCHTDEHRGQLKKDCLTCHTYENWKPASGFDHNKAKFRLTGRHVEVECAKCHPSASDRVIDGDTEYTRFVGIDFAECGACHKDPHRGQFGADCSGCHQTSDWQKMKNGKRFDHSKTRFPLKGLHAGVACESCHKPGKPRRGLAFSKCLDCHNDPHRGQFADHLSKGNCESCHNENGFSPSTFGIAEHQKTNFPLEGSHLAIPCIACHISNGRSTGLQALGTRTRIRPESYVFDIKATRCQDCHKDPHDTAIAKMVNSEAGCLSCHQVESWVSVNFDHQQTGFALEGKHQQTPCAGCHKEKTPGGSVAFAGLFPVCQTCHEDIHFGQFALDEVIEGRKVRMTPCQRCHSPQDWKASLFDHNTMSTFLLEDAHAKTACASCHKPETAAGKTRVIYKPLSGECASCHGGEEKS